jgi:hypothetical protein
VSFPQNPNAAWALHRPGDWPIVIAGTREIFPLAVPQPAT